MRTDTDRSGFSRRTFLGTAAACAAPWSVLAQEAQALYPDRFQIDGGLVVLPGKGKLYVASDFHSRWRQFQEWMDKTDLVARLKGDPDVAEVVDLFDFKLLPDPEVVTKYINPAASVCVVQPDGLLLVSKSSSRLPAALK